jgi:Uma2 family endonuclease
MDDDQVLAPDVRTELLDGEVFEMPPIGPSHASLVSRIENTLKLLYRNSAISWVQNPVLLDQWSMPQPDVAFLKPRDDYYASPRPTPADILLLVEISDTTFRLDRGKKLALYAAAGVPLVWIVNVRTRRMLMFEGPVGGAYKTEAEFGPGDSVDVPGLSTPVAVTELIGE